MQKNSFDSYAHNYDPDFSFTTIGKMQRARVYHFLKAYFTGKKNILEINCGTGEDAKYLSKFGHKIDSSDISSEMIKVCKAKGISDVNFIECDSRSLLDTFKPNSYDIIFSNFGGLNCLSPNELNQLTKDASTLLKESGLLAFVIMGRKCKWENLYFRFKKDNRLNRRKTIGGLETKINDSIFNTYYYSPKELGFLFSSHFTIINSKPIGYFLPPSYFNKFFERKKWLLKIAYILEIIFATFSFQSDSADHYLILLQKNGH